MERVHEEVAEFRALDNGFTADKVSPGTDGDTTSMLVLYALTTFN
jgi:hypothetical protein